MTTHSIKSCILFLILHFTYQATYAQSVGGIATGATSYCSATNSGFVSVTGYKSTILFWQSSTDGGLTWNNNVNQQPNQTYFNLGQTTCFRAVVQDGAFLPDTSTQVCITIYPPAVAGTISGGGVFCANSGAGSLTLTGNVGAITLWQYSETNGVNWTNVPNTTNTQNYSSITKSRLYRVIVQNGFACKKDTSATAALVISAPTFSGSLSGATTVCAAANAGNITLSGNVGNVIAWRYTNNNGATWQTLANTTTQQAYLNLKQPTSYSAIVKSGGCSTDTTAAVLIDVSPTTVPGTLQGGGNFCGNVASGTLTLTGMTGNIANWISSTDGGVTWSPISNTTTIQSYSNITQTTSFAVIVKSASCPADTSTIEYVNVVPKTVAGTISSSNAYCYGLGHDTLLLKGNVGNVIKWLSSNNGGATWTPIANNTTNYVFVNLMQTTLYKAVVKNGYCVSDTTAAVTITIFPKTPVDAGTDATITLGQSISLKGSGAGTPLWTPAASLSNPTVFDPVASPETNTQYMLFVTDINNCVNLDSVYISVLKLSYDGMVSNLFTPNGDGINDTWFLQDIQKFPDNEVKVYNVYGMEVYSKKGYSNDWSGTYNGGDLPDGTYFYVVRFANSDTVLKGSLDILRSK